MDPGTAGKEQEKDVYCTLTAHQNGRRIGADTHAKDPEGDAFGGMTQTLGACGGGGGGGGGDDVGEKLFPVCVWKKCFLCALLFC